MASYPILNENLKNLKFKEKNCKSDVMMLLRYFFHTWASDIPDILAMVGRMSLFDQNSLYQQTQSI